MEDSTYTSQLPEEPTLEDAGNDAGVLKHMIESRTDAVSFLELKDKTDWAVHNDKDGVVLKTRAIEGSDIYMIRCEMELNISATDAMKAFRDTEWLKKVDGPGADIVELKKVDNATRYSYYCIPSMFLVSARDVVNFSHEIELEDDSYLLILKDVKDFEHKGTEGAIRMDISITGVQFEELDDEKCRLTKISHGELGGSIPTTFINWMVGSHHDQFVNIKKDLEA
mmetsp:Transcript_32844/g.29141  ORF Transcript_32844/g.29141 Transcript_32844/m.29141 type:complete len:225 (-) Transcript_32844:39-713(-)